VYGGGTGVICDLFSSASNGSSASSATATIGGRSSTIGISPTSTPAGRREDASAIYHANDEGDERVNDVVEAIKSHVKVKPDVRYVPLEEARHKMGAYADALALDQVVRSPRARAHRMGAEPALGRGECRASAGGMARR
jgi:hypothetical protein